MIHSAKRAISTLAVLVLVSHSGCGPSFDRDGGVVMVYEVASDEAVDAGALRAICETLLRRLDPEGNRAVEIRPSGEAAIQIRIPGATLPDVAPDRRLVESTGTLAFRVMADTSSDSELIERAADTQGNQVIDDEGQVVGNWAPARDSNFQPPPRAATRDSEDNGVEYLLVHDWLADVTAEDLEVVSRGVGQTGAPVVNFRLTERGAREMRRITGMPLPDSMMNRYRYLAIVFDGRIISAPRIQSEIDRNGQITGRFTDQEIDDLVLILGSGALPVALNSEPVSIRVVAAGQSE